VPFDGLLLALGFALEPNLLEGIALSGRRSTPSTFEPAAVALDGLQGDCYLH
jgi:hypothetical protein